MMLITKENTVALYLLLFRLRFFSARSPSMPNNFLVNPDVFTSLPVSFTSAVWRIASMADNLDALLAGMAAEMYIVTIEIKTAASIAAEDTTTLRSSVTINAFLKTGLIK